MKRMRLWSRFPYVPVKCTLSLLFLSLLLSACAPISKVAATPASTAACTGTTAPSTPNWALASQPLGSANAVGGIPLPATLTKPLVFNLTYDDAAMERDLTQIYTPGSPFYHHFLTPDQIVRCYALSDTQMQQVEDWLNSQGYHIVNVDALRSAIHVEAPVATIERSLHVQLKQYTIPLLHYTFFMQDSVPSLPTSLRPLVMSIVGLDNLAFPNIKLPIGFATLPGGAIMGTDCSRYGIRQTLTRDKLAAAYQINQLYRQNLQGQGMTIGVAEFGDPYDPRDVANYAACVGIAPPTIENIDVDGHLAAGTGQGEAAMDLELIAGLAPKAHIIDYQADLNSTSFIQALIDVFNRVATDHRVQVLSVSYGSGEDMFSNSEQVAVARSLRTLAAEGISVFISSGDCGAYSQRIQHLAVVSFPASAPYAIAVGGTHLQVNDQNVRTSETAWSDNDGALLCQNEWGTGGGVSQNASFKRPSWQSGPGLDTHYDGSSAGVITSNMMPVTAPNGLRQVPDVAAAAYPNIAIYYQGAWYAAGGTSAAAPIWAAGTLLVDQSLLQKNKQLIGGVPEFYIMANHAGHFQPYNDIVAGNNLFYPATRGWDYATGWGSPNFADIMQLELHMA
jgi:kumamolisin